MYWESDVKVIRTQDPSTVTEVIRDGLNIYPLLSLDIQIINSCRRNTTVTILERLQFFPSMTDIYAAGAPDDIKCLVPKQFGAFEKYLDKLKQNRWNTVKRLDESEERKRTLLKGVNDTLSNEQLFALSRSLRNEDYNIEYENLRLARESNYISVTCPSAIKYPKIRSHLSETEAESDFIQACKPTKGCVKSSERPYWKDGIDFEHRQEHVLYKLAEHQARFEWKSDRQKAKELNIHLPIGIDYYKWKEDLEKVKQRDIKIDYEKFLVKLDHLSIDVEIENILLDQKIRGEERKMKEEMKKILKRFWMLQKEKKVVSDGRLFEMDMVNERCLPIINSIMDRPRPAPKEIIKVATVKPQLAILGNAPGSKAVLSKEKKDENWNGQWSD